MVTLIFEPRILIESPENSVQSSKDRLPPGSPPPQRTTCFGDTNFLFSTQNQQRHEQKSFLTQYGKQVLSKIPPMITITGFDETEFEAEPLSPHVSSSKIKSSKMTYLSPFFVYSRDRIPSESNLSSSGYSSMASPNGSNHKLCINDIDESKYGELSVSINIEPHLVLKEPQFNDECLKIEKMINYRNPSDPEMLSDETFVESNDEGIGTDQLDDKAEKENIKMAKDLKMLIGNKLLERNKYFGKNEDSVSMSQLQIPSIIIHGLEKNSPISTPSESSLSDRNIFDRFSAKFYGEQPITFTDSDGLYDFPSSEGGTSVYTQNRKSSSKKRERRISSKTSNLIFLTNVIGGFSFEGVQQPFIIFTLT